MVVVGLSANLQTSEGRARVSNHHDPGHTFPALFVKTVAVDLPQDFKLTDALAANGTAFFRNGEGMVGRGCVVKLRAIGPGRMQSLAQQWRQLVAGAHIEDPTSGIAHGLVAFGSFAFDDQSSYESTLTVPKQVLGLRDGRAWLTTIGIEDFDTPTTVDSDWFETPASEQSVLLTPGQVDETGFEQNVATAVSKIAANKLSKVVLARDLTASVPADFDPRPAIANLAKRYPSCWTYWVNGQFGASPELLVRVDHQRVSARVLAGTAGRGTDPEVDRAIAAALLGSPKNAHEHRLAVESLVNALEPFCEEIVADASPFSLALPNLWHLASDVQGIISQDSSVLDLATALHPTAAVAGTPTDAAQLLISELEPFDRGGYAGPVGWIGADGDGEWAIALRGAYLADGKLTAFAGCGIVAGSVPADELAETDLKFKPILQALSGR